jgi:hypothetical protein
VTLRFTCIFHSLGWRCRYCIYGVGASSSDSKQQTREALLACCARGMQCAAEEEVGRGNQRLSKVSGRFHCDSGLLLFRTLSMFD